LNDRLSDEEYALLAARHALKPEPEKHRPERIEALKAYGVTDEKTLAEHTLKVMQAPDTLCHRGAWGNECYANDRLNTIVRTSAIKPERSTVHHNDKKDVKATERLKVAARAENRQLDQFQPQIQIREGGSRALEEDRRLRPTPKLERDKAETERARDVAEKKRDVQQREAEKKTHAAFAPDFAKMSFSERLRVLSDASQGIARLCHQLGFG
jgi:hypothetical protein